MNERPTILRIFSKHWNLHPMIPGQNGTYRTGGQIHQDCVDEIYSWCYSRTYFRLWIYLFIRWYSQDQWVLWARSANIDGIPNLKLVMIIDSHWGRIKHNNLHRFSCSRVDLVSRIISSCVSSQAIEGVKAILNENCRKAIKQELKRLESY